MKDCRAGWATLALVLACSACAGSGRSPNNFSPVNDLPYVIVNTVQESQADLALIFLEEDAEILFPVVPPARTNIRPRDPVVVVGYGADTVQNGLASFDSKRLTRRFGRNLVTQSVREKFTIEAPGSLALPGDSGGPCFREDNSNLTLVGINSRSSPGKKSTFTSTYHYLSWLDAELQHADQM